MPPSPGNRRQARGGSSGAASMNTRYWSASRQNGNLGENRTFLLPRQPPAAGRAGPHSPRRRRPATVSSSDSFSGAARSQTIEFPALMGPPFLLDLSRIQFSPAPPADRRLAVPDATPAPVSRALQRLARQFRRRGPQPPAFRRACRCNAGTMSQPAVKMGLGPLGDRTRQRVHGHIITHQQNPGTRSRPRNHLFNDCRRSLSRGWAESSALKHNMCGHRHRQVPPSGLECGKNRSVPAPLWAYPPMEA